MKSAKILDGRAAADRLLQQLTKRVKQSRRRITLATIVVGQRYDSKLYVKLKVSAAKRVGIRTEQHRLPERTSQRTLETLIKRLNGKRSVNGILLQLPLPSHLSADHAVRTIDPRKDVDGFHPDTTGIDSPPVAAVLKLIALAHPKPGSRVVVLGRRSVLSQTLQARLSSRASSVDVVSARHRIPPSTKTADIIITILGRGPKLQPQHIKPGAIIIDVGIRHERRKTVGDVDPSVWTKAKAISPVPGGVGPLTVAYVLYNTFILSRTN